MSLTESDARRFDTDRVLGMINYGLLFSAVFFVGVPALVAVVIAYAQRPTSGPAMRNHYRFQIQIFWIAFLLALIGGICGLWAVIDLVGQGWRDRQAYGVGDPDFDFSAANLNSRIVGLFIASAVSLALMTVWSLAAPAVGFIRLVTASSDEVG